MTRTDVAAARLLLDVAVVLEACVVADGISEERRRTHAVVWVTEGRVRERAANPHVMVESVVMRVRGNARPVVRARRSAEEEAAAVAGDRDTGRGEQRPNRNG